MEDLPDFSFDKFQHSSNVHSRSSSCETNCLTNTEVPRTNNLLANQENANPRAYSNVNPIVKSFETETRVAPAHDTEYSETKPRWLDTTDSLHGSNKSSKYAPETSHRRPYSHKFYPPLVNIPNVERSSPSEGYLATSSHQVLTDEVPRARVVHNERGSSLNFETETVSGNPERFVVTHSVSSFSNPPFRDSIVGSQNSNQALTGRKVNFFVPEAPEFSMPDYKSKLYDRSRPRASERVFNTPHKAIFEDSLYTAEFSQEPSRVLKRNSTPVTDYSAHRYSNRPSFISVSSRSDEHNFSDIPQYSSGRDNNSNRFSHSGTGDDFASNNFVGNAKYSPLCPDFSQNSMHETYRHPYSPGFESDSSLRNRNVRFSRNQKDPQIFEGNTDFRDYIIHFEHVANWNGWDSYEKAQQLAMSLRGSAQKVLSDLTLGQLGDYFQLKTTLLQKFQPPGREPAHRCEFKSRKRQRDESISEYGYNLRRLASLAYPQLSRHARETYVIDQFIDGLDIHEMRKHVQFGHPLSLEEAITLGLEYEAFDNPHGITRKPRVDEEHYPVSAVKSNQKAKGLEKDFNSLILENFEKLQKEIAELVQSLKKPIYNARRSFDPDRYCSKCGEKGHPYYRCFKSQPKNQKQPQNQVDNNNETSVVQGN